MNRDGPLTRSEDLRTFPTVTIPVLINIQTLIDTGSSGLCGLPIFLACAHSWRKQSTGYAASCRDTEIH